MSKSYRYDPSGDDGFVDRKALRRAKKAEKINRRDKGRNLNELPAEADTDEAPFDVMSTIEPGWAD